MIIKPKCPHCGETVTVNVKKVEKLEKENAELKKQIFELKALFEMNQSGQSAQDWAYNHMMNNFLFGGGK
ncbi:MAG: hypothetical protein PQJ59_16735 [Spirochaetales bacterium]|nr:hypothetical protein [Spirochaetales bacterium]